jgi:GT2 family glycosyltransferase
MTCPVTAIFPAHERVEQSLRTLEMILRCDPRPTEVIVHVDGSSPGLISALQKAFPEISLLTSDTLLGPGGARNRLVAAASHELVANFDDDSYPESPGYFARVLDVAQKFPDAAIISAASHEAEWREPGFRRIGIASGCGCVFRKSWFAKTEGFVPLAVAYSMEESDLGLQLFALGGDIVHDPDLRVKHDHPPIKSVDPLTNARVLANTALLPYLRYPKWLWPVALWHLCSRICHLVARGWTDGLVDGLRLIPRHLAEHRKYRRVVSGVAVLSWLMLNRCPKTIEPRA